VRGERARAAPMLRHRPSALGGGLHAPAPPRTTSPWTRLRRSLAAAPTLRGATAASHARAALAAAATSLLALGPLSPGAAPDAAAVMTAARSGEAAALGRREGGGASATAVAAFSARAADARFTPAPGRSATQCNREETSVKRRAGPASHRAQGAGQGRGGRGAAVGDTFRRPPAHRARSLAS
jgi:hypothetical protein